MICWFLSTQGDVDGENAEPNDRKVSYCSVYILYCQKKTETLNRIKVSAIKQERDYVHGLMKLVPKNINFKSCLWQNPKPKSNTAQHLDNSIVPSRPNTLLTNELMINTEDKQHVPGLKTTVSGHLKLVYFKFILVSILK